MGRKKMKHRYRRFPAITDWGGLKSAVGELRGMGYPNQPVLDQTINSKKGVYGLTK